MLLGGYMAFLTEKGWTDGMLCLLTDLFVTLFCRSPFVFNIMQTHCMLHCGLQAFLWPKRIPMQLIAVIWFIWLAKESGIMIWWWYHDIWCVSKSLLPVALIPQSWVLLIYSGFALSCWMWLQPRHLKGKTSMMGEPGVGMFCLQWF